MDKAKNKNKTEENLKLKSSNISDNEIFEQVAGKENEIEERALVFIEQRYKVPFLYPLHRKHMPRNYKHRINFRTFLTNTDSNEDVKQVFLHKFPDNNRMPIRSHKDIYIGDKASSQYNDISLKENNNNLNKPKDFNNSVLPVYTYRNVQNKVNIVNNDLGPTFNNNALNNELPKLDLNRYDGDPLHNHDRLLREQLITLKDHYIRAQDHENREKQLLNYIKAIKADIDTISAEHREYLELLKVPLAKEIKANINNDFPRVKTASIIEKHPARSGKQKDHKTVLPSITQYYAPPTNIVMKSSPKSPTNNDIIPVEKEIIQQNPKQPQPVVQPAYLRNPPDIDFHDSRILSKIEEMNNLSASMDKNKRSSSTATINGLAGESNRTTRASEMEHPCVISNCPKHCRPFSKTTTVCDCKHISSSTHYSVLPWKAYSESTVFLKASTDGDLNVFQL